MKICAKCKESKSESEFGFKDKGRLQPYCRPCNNEHNRKYYAANKEKQKAVILIRNQRYREELRIWIRALKEASPCLDCKTSYSWYVMDYDHIGNDKEFNISYMVASLYSRANIEKEIAKCELVCANCHRERTFNRDALDI